MLQQIAAFDAAVSAVLQAHATPALLAFMAAVSQGHAAVVIHAATLALGGLLWWRKERWALWLLPLVPLGSLLNHILKHAIRRPRPGQVGALGPTDFAFPSGHVANVTLFYGLIALLIVLRFASWPLRAAAILAASLMVALVGLSRLMLGAHHFSDVAGAILLSLLWLLLYTSAVRRRWPRLGKR